MATLTPPRDKGRWPAMRYEEWSATCDTLHAHTQVLGKLAVQLAPPEPQLQHTALRLTPRGWETSPLPAPDGSGLVVAGLDLRTHQAFVEHTNGTGQVVPLTPDRPVGEVTREVLAAVRGVAGPVEIFTRPQEVPWTLPLDEDDEHHTYDRARVVDYLMAATQAAVVLAELRAPYRGRVSPVNAWWGTFDLAVSFFSGRATDPPTHGFIARNAGNAEQIEVGWWPGDARYPKAAFYAFASPAPDGFAHGPVSPPPARWDDNLGEYIFDWGDVVAAPDPRAAAVEFGRSVIAHGTAAGHWDPYLASSALGDPAPLT